MSFRTRPIRKRPPVHPLRRLKSAYGWFRVRLAAANPRHKSYLIGLVLVLVAAVIVVRVMLSVYAWVRNFEFQDLFLAAGSDLHQDEYGYTNILLLGDGGHVRDGADLVDTIMVASLNHKENAVTLFSIPRDFYVNTQYNSRINELYRNHKNLLGDNGAFDLFKEVVGKIASLDIHYYLRVDFKAFVEVVDALGGIDLEVPVAIDDPYYPNETDDGYDPFQLSAGMAHLDGETALKYVRSRKTTSDFDRAHRQQLVLTALREKALSKNIFTKSGTIKKLYGAVKRNINTDLTLREMLGLGKFAKNFDRARLVTKVLNDDPGQDGGFLYTPERELYGGQFVLVPFTDTFSLIHKYASLIFHQREAFYRPLKIEILNATKISGIAGNAAYQLNRFGFNVVKVDNLMDAGGERSFAEKSVIRYYDWTSDKDGNVLPDHPVFLNAMQELVKAEAVPADPTLKREADITVILGADYDVFLVD